MVDEAFSRPEAAAEVRQRLYQLLAQGFRPPSSGLGEAWPQEDLASLAEAAAELFPHSGISRAVEEVATSLKAWQGRDVLKLEVEYNRLFVGPGHLEAAPYESVYTSPEGLVMGEAAADVLRRYAEEGLGLSPSFKDLPDHVAVELEFMAYLCYKELECWQREDWEEGRRYLAQERGMLRDHLSRWISLFRRRLAAATEEPLYRALASLVEACIAWDQSWVGALTQALASLPEPEE